MNGLKKMPPKEVKKRIFFALIGIILVGIGVGFNASAMLGNDSIGIFYDGVRNFASLSDSQLGMTSNIVNIVLIVLIFITGRQYLSIGTFIYILPYGFLVDMGHKLYHILFKVQTMPYQIIGAAAGCLLLYIGVSMFIAANIGLDPFTGIVMIIRDKLKLEYRVVKIGFDIFLIITGMVLGGKAGIVTFITALLAGPFIQLLSDMWIKINKRYKCLLE